MKRSCNHCFRAKLHFLHKITNKSIIDAYQTLLYPDNLKLSLGRGLVLRIESEEVLLQKEIAFFCNSYRIK